MLYHSNYWAIKKAHENKLIIAKMRMLRWTMVKLEQDNKKTEGIRGTIGVA